MAKGLWPVINVDNVEKSVELYKMLGLRARADPMEMPGMPAVTVGTIEVGDSGIIIWNKNAVPADQPADTRAWLSGDLGKGVMFTVGVPNAQKVWANAQKLRLDIEQPLETQPWGGHGFTFVDLDGYVVNVTDKFPDMSPPKKAVKKSVKNAAKKVATKAKKVVGKRR